MDKSVGGTPDIIKESLRKTANDFEKMGFKKWNLILDPGIGFGKKG